METYTMVRESIQARARTPDIIRTRGNERVVSVEDQLRPVKFERARRSSRHNLLQCRYNFSQLASGKPS